MAQALQLPKLVGVLARAAGIDNLFLPRSHISEVSRKPPAGAPKIHLERECVLARTEFERPLQRRVGNEAPVPVKFAVDFDSWKARRQRAAGKNVARVDRLRRCIEILKVAGAHIHCAGRIPRAAPVQALEVNQLRKRFTQGACVVIARGVERTVRLKPGWNQTRRKEAGSTGQRGDSGAQLIEALPDDV